MKRADLIEALLAYDGVLRENGATGLYLFGSRARGEERPDSDLDLFIDDDPRAKIPSMFRLMQIEETISRSFGVPVTITTRDALHPLDEDEHRAGRGPGRLMAKDATIAIRDCPPGTEFCGLTFASRRP